MSKRKIKFMKNGQLQTPTSDLKSVVETDSVEPFLFMSLSIFTPLHLKGTAFSYFTAKTSSQLQ